MKYRSKKLNDTEYAVFTGKRYFKDTVTTNKLKAIQSALIMSMSFYQDQLDHAFSELEKTCVDTNRMGDIKLEGNEYYTNKGDLMC